MTFLEIYMYILVLATLTYFQGPSKHKEFRLAVLYVSYLSILLFLFLLELTFLSFLFFIFTLCA